MKLVSIIMAFLVLALSAWPCSDHDHPGNSGVEFSTDAGTHDASGHAGDDCSPFCTCTCCAAVAVYNVTVSHFNFNPSLKAYTEILPDSPLSSFSLSIWQPPRMS